MVWCTARLLGMPNLLALGANPSPNAAAFVQVLLGPV